MVQSEPEEKMEPEALKAWRLNGILNFILYIIIFVTPAFAAYYFLEPYPSIVLWAVSGLTAFAGILQIIIIPMVRMHYWRYEIKEHEVDIQYGIIIIRRSLIPVSRIQHVDTEQGPVLRFFGLSTLSISTAGTTHKIPALKKERALELREHISRLASVSEEDV